MSVWLLVVVFLLAAAGTGIVRRHALARQLLDVPNSRSSHVVPVPRGGGLAIVASVALASVFILASGGGETATIPLLGLPIAAVGWLDDTRGMSVRVRLFIQAVASAVVAWRFPIQALPWPGGHVTLGLCGFCLALPATIWCVNLFNFMDGIDGIAGAEAIFVFGSAMMLIAAGGGGASSLLSLSLGAVAAAAAGFLLWNWQPAKIFMGDVGSAYLGFLIGAFALSAAVEQHLPIWTWIVLGGAFFADATVTLAVRALRGERVYDAHRSHVYQRLARRWRSHALVVLAYTAVNVCWLLPWAVACVRRPQSGLAYSSCALAPLIVAAVLLGAGRREPGSVTSSC
ncbi:MAG: glycosyltransferase family 4 protein [Proteobacteria bacterium]|nr:glycosyltransferase family 4 protein [Pseudomonadota bacterium]